MGVGCLERVVLKQAQTSEINTETLTDQIDEEPPDTV